MSVLINADTSDGLKFTSDTSGEVKIQSAGADIVTVDSSGITMAAGKTIPAASLTGTLPAIDGSALTGISSYADSDALSLLNASGSAPVYAARAWVNFDGTGTVAIRSSGNVSSITDNGTGNYTVNFTTAMSDSNYALATSVGDVAGGAPNISVNYATPVYSTTQVKVQCWNYAGSVYDSNRIGITIFR